MVNNVNSNAITAPQVIGSYTDKREAEGIQKLENHYRSRAMSVRRKFGIHHDGPIDRNSQAGRQLSSYMHNNFKSGRSHQWNFAKDASFRALSDMVLDGRVNAAYGAHPIFGSDGLVLPLVESAENFKFANDVMSEQFRSLFSRNGIHIPTNLKLLFIVDPATFQVRVTGTDDTDLISRIEEMLNYGGNGGQLAQFIFESNAMPMTQEQRQQFMLMQRVRFVTGLDMRDMNIVDGRFVTADGRDLMSIFEKAARLSDSEPGRADAETGFIRGELERLAPIWDSIPELSFQIGWQNGGLLTAQGQRIGLNIMA